MKYDTFVKLRGAGVVGVVTLALWGGCRAVNKSAEQPPAPPVQQQVQQEAPPPQAPTNEQPAPTSPQQPPSNGALSDADNYVLQLQQKPLSNGTSDGKSLKWRFKENGVTFEFRSDTNKGSKTWNRAKVDLNSNKKFEQQWTFGTDGAVTRKVAPNDDENYTVTQRLSGDKWVE